MSSIITAGEAGKQTDPAWEEDGMEHVEGKC